MDPLQERILRRVGVPDLMDRLDRLSSADLNSLLLALFQRRAERNTMAGLVRDTAESRFCAPAALDPVAYALLESRLLSRARDMGFIPELLSPAAPLGSCSAFDCVHQNNVVSALRGVELLADPTNMLALLQAQRLRKAPEAALHSAACARVTRAQAFPRKDLSAHFGLFCMVSTGVDGGSYCCERELLTRQLRCYEALLADCVSGEWTLTLRARGGYTDGAGFLTRMEEAVRDTLPRIRVERDDRPSDNAYYQGLNFKIYLHREGTPMELGDGGFVDWHKRLTGNRKRRCLISAMSLDRLVGLAYR